MNYLWPILIIISYLFALVSGNIEKLNESIFSSIDNVIQMALTMMGNMCLWCGIMEIVKSTKIMKYIRKITNPILNWLFPDEKNNSEIMEDITINTVSNIIGIGNAATPAGLRAMEKMQKNNQYKKIPTKSMATFIVLNSASIQIIPTTAIAIRASLNSQNPSEIIIPVWISTIIGTLAGLIINKIIQKNSKK